MRNPIFARLLLISALLFVQVGGLTHSFSHVLGGQTHSDEQSPAHDKHCDLCDAYDQIASAIGSSIISFVSSENYETPPLNTPYSYISNTFVAFAARAPPYSA
jgi:hypothetical protein